MSLHLPHVPRSWYPACTTRELHSTPRFSEIASTPLCLYRDAQGRANCVSDVCPHRGAPLHKGRVVDDRIACPYHGFEFDGTGRLQYVPSEPGCRVGHCKSCPSASILRAYPVTERGGFVWIFFDDACDPDDLFLFSMAMPVPVVPELVDPDWFLTFGEFEFRSGWQPVFENALDNSHIHFLHGNSFGNEDVPEIRNVKTRAVDATVAEATFDLTNKPVDMLWNWTAVPEVHVTARAYLPSVSYIRFELGGGISFLTYVATVPVSETRTVNRYVLGRTKFPGRIWDPMARSAMERIFEEDRAMIETLYPFEAYEERSVRADALQILWRHLVNVHMDVVREEDADDSGGEFEEDDSQLEIVTWESDDV